MMILRALSHFALAVLLTGSVAAGLAGCKSKEPQRGPYPALEKLPPSLETTETLVLLDAALQGTITITDQRASFTNDGRLVAEANVRNLIERMQNVQVQTVFKDENNMSHGDESAWQTMVLNPNATETYRATALNDKSAKYTIRIRFAR